MQRKDAKARDPLADLAFGLREVWAGPSGGVTFWDRIADQFETEGSQR
ncbi:hypothetical protein [Tropicibacter naphthalenivorans]|uniref:Uncharacterized protein n=1 Tax=Tropicibacter naphthalenivorans TaxID=441103 RepID=A0A0P1G1C3_9RHOB|nr:hypothetical protein [Tropicibacter naphthalenivorans]CUH75339.1 hypothetical protein TRN7648_00388 [Tropicibacter naphthalenivorans]SMC44998.1 hypothetical protein SAMN04488093_101491 [Tropicibacter naphthalenivorans]